jgi:hypothetical protein
MNIMKIAFFLSILPQLIFAQDIEMIFQNYHKNIDPQDIVRNIKSVTLKRHYIVTNLKTFEIQNYVSECTNYSNEERCIYLENFGDSKVDLSKTLILPPFDTSHELIKSMLHLISFEKNDSDKFSILERSDSLVLVEEQVSLNTVKVYSFDIKNNYFVNIKRQVTAPNFNFFDEVSYQNYRRINGILIPGKIEIRSSLFTASVELLEVKFEFYNTK